MVSRKIDAATVDKAVVRSSQAVTFSGTGITSSDKAKWVAGTDCSADAAGGSAEVTIASDGSTTFVFTSAGLAFNLCYKFASEPFALYSTIKMNAYAPSVTANLDDAVVGVAKTLTFTGPKGITAGDTAEWVVNGASDCSGAAQGGQDNIASTR